MPDLLRFTALYELVKGQQALCMGPAGELRNPVQNLLWGVLLVRNELATMHSQAWTRPRAVQTMMFKSYKGHKVCEKYLYPPEHEKAGRGGS